MSVEGSSWQMAQDFHNERQQQITCSIVSTPRALKYDTCRPRSYRLEILGTRRLTSIINCFKLSCVRYVLSMIRNGEKSTCERRKRLTFGCRKSAESSLVKQYGLSRNSIQKTTAPDGQLRQRRTEERKKWLLATATYSRSVWAVPPCCDSALFFLARSPAQPVDLRVV